LKRNIFTIFITTALFIDINGLNYIAKNKSGYIQAFNEDLVITLNKWAYKKLKKSQGKQNR